MTAQEIQKRNGKAQKLRVIQVDEETFYVESSEGKICYRVSITDHEISCACGDFSRGIKSDPKFRCKHIMSVLNCNVKDIKNGEVLEKKPPKLDPRFVKTIEGRDFALYSGLLDLAHQKGLLKLEVEAIQYPTKENEHLAICKAVAFSSNGEVYTDIGDASPTNCSSRVSKHILRMSSTRAKARALRDMTNIGMTCLEELDTADLGENGSTHQKPESRKAPTPARKSGGNGKETQSPKRPETSGKGKPEKESSSASQGKPKNEEKPESGSKQGQENLDGVPKMSEAQKRACLNLSRRRGISVEELEKMSQESYGTTLENLSSKDASSFIRQLQTAA